jgi:LysR family transcriptional regulator AphB
MAADLVAHDCIRAAGQAGPTTWRLNGPDGTSQIAVSGRFGANTGPAQNKAAVAGLGICLLPISSLQASLLSGELVEVLPGVASSVGNMYVVYPSRRHVPRAVTAFVEMAVQRLAPLIQPTVPSTLAPW